MTARSGWLSALYPAAFAAGYVFMSFANTPTPVSGLGRPLLVAVLLAAAISIVLGVVVRSRPLGAVLASVVVLLFAAPWLALVLGTVLATWLLALRWLRRRRGTDFGVGLSTLTSRLPAFAMMFAIVTAATAVPAALVSLTLPDHAAATRAATDDRLPNIYVLMLDGYPRSDVLESEFAIDNTAFEASLEELGFDVARDSRSNYTATWASLVSMFHGRYLEDIDGVAPFPTDQAEQYFVLMRALNTAPLLELLSEAGYRIVTVPSPFENAALFTADEVRPTGHLTSFELSLIQHSPLIHAVVAVASDALVDQQRQRVIAALQEFSEIATGPDDQPVFGFVHVFSPHAPMVFAEDGGTAPLPACFPDRCSMWQLVDDEQWLGLPAQIEHLNRHVLPAVESVVEADPQAAVLVMSDHGALPPGADRQTMLSNFLAIRSPGHSNLLTEEPHTVNVLTSVLDAYLGIEAELLPYRGWTSETDHPLSVDPVE